MLSQGLRKPYCRDSHNSKKMVALLQWFSLIHIILGDAAEEVLNYVQSEGIDLVIMGTHGRKGLEHIIFGSVAERVVKQSPVPVLTVNPYGKPLEGM